MRRRRIRTAVPVLASLLVLAGLGVPSAAGTAPSRPARQMWVWHYGSAQRLLAVSGDARVTELLVWTPPGFTRHRRVESRLQRLIRLARRDDVSVTALGGDPSWVNHPRRAGRWAREVAASGMFSAVHLDVEPNALPGWSTHERRLGRGLLTVISETRRSGLPVSADIPAWFDTVHLRGTTLDRAVIRTTAGVSVMAYHDSARGIVAAARPELRHAAAQGKQGFVGINVAPAGPDEPTTTLYGQPHKKIRQAIRAVASAPLRGRAGIALEDYTYSARLWPH